MTPHPIQRRKKRIEVAVPLEFAGCWGLLGRISILAQHSLPSIHLGLDRIEESPTRFQKLT